MKLALSAFEAAVRLHLAPALASLLAQCLATMRGEPVGGSANVDDSETGELLLRALLGCPEALAPVELQAAHMMLPTETLTLSAGEAAAHPWLAGWIEPSLSAALAAPIIAGTRLTQAAPFAPTFGQVQLIEAAGVIAGSAQLGFQSAGGSIVPVFVQFGPIDTKWPLVTARLLDGTTLTAIGRAARPSRAIEVRDDIEAPGVVTLQTFDGGGTVH